jgi:hypothetical protein
MIIKQKDSLADAEHELQGLLNLPLDNRQRSLVEREFKALQYGKRGEQDSAYFLDFAYGKSQNFAIIHDLRIEWQGRVAQIDHLLINRLLEIFVLETKNFFGDLRVNEQGEFTVDYGKKAYGIESPIEQNTRHVEVLKDRIAARGLAPTRLGIPLPLSYLPYVLVSPKSNIDRPVLKKFDATMVVKADQFQSENERRIDKLSAVTVLAAAGKMIGSETLETFAKGIASMHRPGKINYRAKFGIPESLTTAPLRQEPCQGQTPVANGEMVAGKCDKCGAGVEAKVVAFCRFNRAKLGGHKVLCRGCQKII